MANTSKATGETVAASDQVRGEWLRRVEAEYRSAAITQHLGLWLIQIGAAPELITDALRIVGDELTHAELSHAVYIAAGGSGMPNLRRESLGLPRSGAPLEQDVVRHGVEVFCLGETIAVRLFKRLRQKCRVTAARRALDRILQDEVRHRDFGWTLLEWMLSRPDAVDFRALLAAELPGMVGRIRRNYAGAVKRTAATAHRGEAPFSEDDRAWGLMPRHDYAEAVEETIARDYRQRFRELGIELDATT